MMYEIWWEADGHDVARAKFRSLRDALYYAWRHGRGEDARVRHPDGRWEGVCAYEVPRGRQAKVSPSSGSHPSWTPVPTESRPYHRLREDPRITSRDIACEVMVRTGIRDAELVECIVGHTLAVLKAMGSPREPVVHRRPA